MGELAAGLLILALIYLLVGRGVVGAAHTQNPRLRAQPQVTQFLGVLLWGPIAAHNWWVSMRKRRRNPWRR